MNAIRIMPVGMPAQDLQVVKSLCWISANRPRAYVMCAPGERPDFYLVDGDKSGAIVQAEAARARHSAPVIVLASNDAAAGPHAFLRRPIVASRMLKAFDDLAILVLGRTPDINIGEGAVLPAGRLSGIINRSEQSTLQMGPATRMRGGATAPRLGTALVVDDSPTVRKQLELGLNNLGVDVDLAEDGDTAMHKAQFNRYDIIFLDVVLPGADGYQICKAIKKDKVAHDTPVIMLTGKSSPFDRIKGSLAGCDTYLTKPVNNETFRTVVEKYLGKWSAQAAGDGQRAERLPG